MTGGVSETQGLSGHWLVELETVKADPEQHRAKVRQPEAMGRERREG